MCVQEILSSVMVAFGKGLSDWVYCNYPILSAFCLFAISLCAKNKGQISCTTAQDDQHLSFLAA